MEEIRNGRKQWVYYANTDWYHELYNDRHPVQQHSVSITGGNKDVKYFLSGAYDRQSGVIKLNPDVFQKYNLRAKIDARLNKVMRLSNNTSFFSSAYDYPGGSSVQDSFAYAARHALASFPLKNPDGSWLYANPLISGNYNVANGRHLVFGENKHRNQQLRTDFSNYEYYTTGAGEDSLEEVTSTSQRHAVNVFGTYDNTFAEKHHLTVTGGMNMEDWSNKSVGALGKNLLSETLNDLNLVGPDETGNVITEVSGGQNAYAIMGFFGRINYDFKERYLFEGLRRPERLCDHGLLRPYQL